MVKKNPYRGIIRSNKVSLIQEKGKSIQVCKEFQSIHDNEQSFSDIIQLTVALSNLHLPMLTNESVLKEKNVSNKFPAYGIKNTGGGPQFTFQDYITQKALDIDIAKAEALLETLLYIKKKYLK